MERCESGRIGLPAKELCLLQAPWVRIPPSPNRRKAHDTVRLQVPIAQPGQSIGLRIQGSEVQILLGTHLL